MDNKPLSQSPEVAAPVYGFVLRYPAFAFVRPGRGAKDLSSIERRNQLIVLLFLGSFLVAAAIDRTFIMRGIDVGFLEHPTIFAFLLLHLVGVRVLFRASLKLRELPRRSDTCLNHTDSRKIQRALATIEHQLSSPPTGWSAGLLTALYLVGAACFIWNSFQNQQPLRFLGFDFWDSSHHTAGYWVTRAYKFYLFCLLLPALAHGVFVIVQAFWRLLESVKEEGGVALDPFQVGRSGGCDRLVEPLTTILYPLIVVGAIANLSALLVHRELDLTPVIGIALLFLGGLFLFFGYSWPLRIAIERERRYALSRIAQLQAELCQRYLRRGLTGDAETASLRLLDDLRSRFLGLPAWPHLRPVTKALSLITGSQYALVLLKAVLPLLIN